MPIDMGRMGGDCLFSSLTASGIHGSLLKNTRSDFVHMLSFAFRDQLKTEDSLDSPTSPSQ